MYGFRDEFEYFQCSNCECLQAAEIHESLSKYYSEDYYSFSTPELTKLNKIMWFFKHQRTGYCLSSKGAMGGILVKLFGRTHLPEWIGSAGVHVDSRRRQKS